jgi:hypothetical protein
MGVPLIYLPTGVAFCFTAGIQLVTRSLDVFVWVVVRAGSPNISFLVAVPALKESEQSEELNLQHSALQVRHKYTG